MTVVKVEFYDKGTEKAYYEVKKNDPDLFRFIDRATDDIKKNPHVGEYIPLGSLPATFFKQYPGIKGMPVFKYELPKAWRILYAVANNKIEILAILLKVCDHKDYEKVMRYHKHG